jgi:subtilase family serine protease
MSMGPVPSHFTVTLPVTPTVYGNLVNTATVDPDNIVTESNEGNNTGADTLNVNNAPTVVRISSFTATRAKNSISVKWMTDSETDNLGFNLYRATSLDGARNRLNSALIPALPGSQSGADYVSVT